MQEITLKLRYRPNTKMQIITIQTDKKSLTIEELAELFSQKLADNYKKYLGNMNKHDYEKYKYGQYKLILQYLEVKI